MEDISACLVWCGEYDYLYRKGVPLLVLVLSDLYSRLSLKRLPGRTLSRIRTDDL